jgi:hypothetical protein
MLPPLSLPAFGLRSPKLVQPSAGLGPVRFTSLHEGYGAFTLNGRGMKAHRASMILHGHDVPRGMPVDHTCRNRACVNPAHLRIVTPKINTLENSAAITAQNAAKTHCHRGHEFTPKNTRLKNGWRNCRACVALERKRRKARRRAALPLPQPKDSDQ